MVTMAPLLIKRLISAGRWLAPAALMAAAAAISLTTPRPASACSPIYTSTSSIDSSDAPACLVLEGTEHSSDTGMAIAISADNKCPSIARLTCVSTEAQACNEPVELQPETKQIVELPGASTLSWQVGMDSGTVKVSAEGEWSGCGSDGPFSGCSLAPLAAPTGFAAPAPSALLISACLALLLQRRRQSGPSSENI